MDSSTTKRDLLRVVSYNVQVGISTSRPYHYVTGSWKHLFPHAKRLSNLDAISHLVNDFDLVGLQEVDAGSIRSNFINMTEYLAERGHFPYWHHQVNRNLGKVAQHSNGLLSRFKPSHLENIRLPGIIPGRQALMSVFETEQDSLAVFVLHLALSKRARMRQLDYIADRVNEFPHAIVMGDLNCRTESDELQNLFKRTHLREPLEQTNTFPSWRPRHHIDHILVTEELAVKNVSVIDEAESDHLPISMDVVLPETLKLEWMKYESLPDRYDLAEV